MIDMQDLVDFADDADAKVGRFQIDFILSETELGDQVCHIPVLNWQCIRYGEAAEIDKVPDDKRGIYAFSIQEPGPIMPPHGYILYIGIAGKNSNRSLRARYKEYLNSRMVRKRARIARMIGRWGKVLKFNFAPIDDAITSDELELLEKKLTRIFSPPFSVGDVDADLKEARRAFA